MERHRHTTKFSTRKQLFLAAVLATIGILIVVDSSPLGKPFLSPEVKFTDLSKGGLQIVPASCPSSPDYTGQCDGTAPPPSMECSLTASTYSVSPGQTITLAWDTNPYTAAYSPSPDPSITVTLDTYYGSVHTSSTVYSGPDPVSGSQERSGTVPTTIPSDGANQSITYVLNTYISGIMNQPIVPPCDADVTVGSSPPPPPPGECSTPGIATVYRYYDPGLGAHWLSNSPNPPSGSYSYEGEPFFLEQSQVAGTQPLYECVTGGGRQYISNDAGCEGNGSDQGVLGYAYASQISGTTLVYRLYQPNTGDHLTTINPSEGTSNGYVLEGGQGYVYSECPDATVTCPDGSPAPNNDPSQCTCAQGNINACNNVVTCPDGSPAPNNDPSQCSCTSSSECGSGLSCSPNTGECNGDDNGTSANCDAVGYEYAGGQCIFLSCPTGWAQQGALCLFHGCPSGYTEETDANGNPECVMNACGAGYICHEGNQYYQDASCTISASPTQICNYGCQAGACNPPPAPEIAQWSVKPILVRTKQTTNITWQAQNVQSCSIIGTNGDSWTGLSGTEASSPITAQTTYTITCQALPGAFPATAASSTVVSIAPNFCETGAPNCP